MTKPIDKLRERLSEDWTPEPGDDDPDETKSKATNAAMNDVMRQDRLRKLGKTTTTTED